MKPSHKPPNNDIKAIHSSEPTTQKMEVIDVESSFIPITMEKVKKKKKKKKKDQFTKSTLNIIRTTMRNNMELISIADNKANMLLSLNAIMITFLVPFTFSYLEEFLEYNLILPLVLLMMTCVVTISIAAKVLKPGKFNGNQKELKKGKMISPFFYGNYYNMEKDAFHEYIDTAVSAKNLIKNHLTEDLYFIGSSLGRKLMLMRVAISVFMTGMFISILLAFALILILS